MDAEQADYQISGYRIIVTESLYAILSSSYLPTLEHFVNIMNARLNAFCIYVKGHKIDDLDLDALVLDTFQVFYAIVLGTTASDVAATAMETFTNFLTLNYVMLTPLDEDGSRVNVLQLVMDTTPAGGHASPAGQDFLMWRSIHERSLNTIH